MSAMPPRPFDPKDMELNFPGASVVTWLVENPLWWLGLFRRFKPVAVCPRGVPKLGDWALITRYDDVQEALRQDDIFTVLFGDRSMEIIDGPNFMLTMDDGPGYQSYRRQIMRAFKREDMADVVAPLSARCAQDIVARSPGKLDAIKNLITQVQIEICRGYYGLTIPDGDTFAEWSFAISAYIFGDLFDNPGYRRAALGAGDRLRPLINESISAVKRAIPLPDTVLGRLIEMQRATGGDPSDDTIRAIMIGMVTGFVPTNTLAGGHILDTLLRRPDALARTRAAALANDDPLLKRCLFEALRFKNVHFGPIRQCPTGHRIGQRGTLIPAGKKVLVSTQAAMFDPRNVTDPKRFDPDRPAAENMTLGHGLHWCIGVLIAEAQLVQTFKALLVRNNLRRAPGREGKLRRFGPAPRHLLVEFDR